MPFSPLRARGFTIIEIILAIAMITISFVAVSQYYKKVLDVSENTTRHIQSGFLLEEGLEAAKIFRDTGWTANIAALSTTTSYYFHWNGTTWVATATPEMVENVFTRSFTLSDVYRDASDDIASSGTYDPGTKKVTVNVAWLHKGTQSAGTDTAETYITDLFSN